MWRNWWRLDGSPSGFHLSVGGGVAVSRFEGGGAGGRRQVAKQLVRQRMLSTAWQGAVWHIENHIVCVCVCVVSGRAMYV